MTRIDVVPADKGKGKFKVLVNFGSLGSFVYGCVKTANHEAAQIATQYPNADLHLAEEK